MKKSKSQPYACHSCGATYSRWLGQCENCNAWNTIEELMVAPQQGASKVVSLSSLKEAQDPPRSRSGLVFLDRLLEGGLPRGTCLFMAGEPGIGKSTLLFQMFCRSLVKALYISAEESLEQVGQRFKKWVSGDRDYLLVASESRLGSILALMDQEKPQVMIIDSLQMLSSDNVDLSRGGHASLREMAELLVSKAKQLGITLWLVGHVNKEGEIAGPKVLEHLVDAVLTFHLADDFRHRLLQVTKNRYGRSGDLAVLEMTQNGLVEAENQDQVFAPTHEGVTPGSALTVTLVGSRMLAVEVQALCVNSYFPSPKRSATGFDVNRLNLLLAVLEKKLRIPFSRQDVYLNIVGGLRLSDPASDLAVAAALISADAEKALPLGAAYIGEVGLTGEIRKVPLLEERSHFLKQRGMKVIYGPHQGAKLLPQLKFLSHLNEFQIE